MTAAGWKLTNLTGMTLRQVLNSDAPDFRVKMVPSFGRLRPFLVVGPPRKFRVRAHVKPLPLP